MPSGSFPWFFFSRAQKVRIDWVQKTVCARDVLAGREAYLQATYNLVGNYA